MVLPYTWTVTSFVHNPRGGPVRPLRPSVWEDLVSHAIPHVFSMRRMVFATEIPTRQIEGYIVSPHPQIQSPDFHFVEFNPPVDSGRTVWLARFLYSLLQPSPELLIWLGNWAVWPSNQHIPLFTRFREAFGEKRPLIDAP